MRSMCHYPFKSQSSAQEHMCASACMCMRSTHVQVCTYVCTSGGWCNKGKVCSGCGLHAPPDLRWTLGELCRRRCCWRDQHCWVPTVASLSLISLSTPLCVTVCALLCLLLCALCKWSRWQQGSWLGGLGKATSSQRRMEYICQKHILVSLCPLTWNCLKKTCSHSPTQF